MAKGGPNRPGARVDATLAMTGPVDSSEPGHLGWALPGPAALGGACWPVSCRLEPVATEVHVPGRRSVSSTGSSAAINHSARPQSTTPLGRPPMGYWQRSHREVA
jgi:hypothetical protein